MRRVIVQKAQQAQLHDVIGAEIIAIALYVLQAPEGFIGIIEHHHAVSDFLFHLGAVHKIDACVGVDILIGADGHADGKIGLFQLIRGFHFFRQAQMRARAVLFHRKGDADAAGIGRLQQRFPQIGAGDAFPAEDEFLLTLLRAAVAVEFIIMDNFAQTVLFIFLFRLRLCRNHSFFGNRRLFLDLGDSCFLFVFCLYRRERGAARHKTGRDAGRHSHKGHRSFKAAVIQQNAVLRKRRDPAAKLAPADQRHVHLFSQAHFCAQRLFQNAHFPASFCSLPSVKKGNIFLYRYYNIRL